MMGKAARRPSSDNGMGKATAWLAHLAIPALAATFGIGFLILFAFIGTFTYVNFVLVRSPLSLGPMSSGPRLFRVLAGACC